MSFQTKSQDWDEELQEPFLLHTSVDNSWRKSQTVDKTWRKSGTALSLQYNDEWSDLPFREYAIQLRLKFYDAN